MRQICLANNLRDCQNQSCGAKNSLEYRMEGNGGDEYYCKSCGIIYLWNDQWQSPKKTEDKVADCFIIKSN
jgi:hypothetical protein